MAETLNDSFASATKILFGRHLSPLERYSGWLLSRIAAIHQVPSAIGKGTATIPEYSFFGYIPKSRVVCYEESAKASAMKINEPQADASLASLLPEIQKIAYFVPTFSEGTNINVKNTTCHIDCLDVEKSFDPFETKHSSHVFQTLRVDKIFGCYFNLDTAFSIHCYNCFSVQRCFEMDTAKNCSDCYFCHNVENLQDCMFCFNTKSKRYAIGNLEVGREKYMEFKRKFQAWAHAELEKNGRLPFDIYDVLAKRH